MRLSLVPTPAYQGQEGIEQLREVRNDLIKALRDGDWPRVRELDRACGALVDRVLQAELDDKDALVETLSDLKGVYFSLIERCQDEVTRMAL